MRIVNAEIRMSWIVSIERLPHTSLSRNVSPLPIIRGSIIIRRTRIIIRPRIVIWTRVVWRIYNHRRWYDESPAVRIIVIMTSSMVRIKSSRLRSRNNH
jgi:hypothetical protein